MDGPEQQRDLAGWLASPAAVEALAAARRVRRERPDDPLGAATLLRDLLPGLDVGRCAAALDQADLAVRARDRYGIDAGGLLLTRDGLEQATRPAVAARRARLFAGAGVRRVLDLTGGLGFDAAAFLAAGLTVTVVERDPAVAAFLAHNCPAARVVSADVTAPGLVDDLLADLGAADVVFVDPARRDPDGPRDRTSGRARPERDPLRWSPPWPFVAAIDHPRVTAKVAPGFTPPGDWQAEWVSVDRTIVECAVSSWPLAAAHRQAVIVGSGPPLVLPGGGPTCPVGDALAGWLHEPDPAVVRAGALGALAAADPDLRSVGPDSSWLTSDRPSRSPGARSYLVVATLTGSPRRQRRQLAVLGVSRATVKSRDVDVDPRRTLRGLGLAEGPEWVLVTTHRAGRTLTVLTQPAAARSG